MDTLLIIIAGLAIVAGIAGTFLPILPGPPLAWAGLLLLHFTPQVSFTTNFLVGTALITLAVTALDYLLPIWATRRSGGTKYGERGAVIGMIIGVVFAGPLGVIVGPLMGAFAGELVHDHFNWQKASRSAWYSFVGFLLSVGLQLGWCLVILFWYVRALVY